jgi:hypothetical protein
MRKRSRRQRRLPRPENRNALRPTEFCPERHLRNAVLRTKADQPIPGSAIRGDRRSCRFSRCAHLPYAPVWRQLLAALSCCGSLDRDLRQQNAAVLDPGRACARGPLPVSTSCAGSKRATGCRKGISRRSCRTRHAPLYGHDLGDISPAERRRISLTSAG